MNSNTSSDLSLVRLTDVCSVSTGKSNVQDAVINGQYLFFDRSKEIKKSNKYLFDCEAIIVPGEGQEFIPQYYKGKFDLHQRAYALIPKENVCGLYVYYAVLLNRNHFAHVATGSTVKSLRLNSFESMMIPLPSLENQKRISRILYSFDKLIASNSEINDYLGGVKSAS